MAMPHPNSQAAERRRAAVARARDSRARAARENLVDRLLVESVRVEFSSTTPEVDRAARRIWAKVYDDLVRHQDFTREEALAAIRERVKPATREMPHSDS